MTITRSTMPPKVTMLPPGVYTPVISLYQTNQTQDLDLEAMYKHCQYLVRAGMHGLVYQGTNGEAVLLTREERIQVLKMARKAVTDLGRPAYPLVAGISAESTNMSIQLAQDATEAGASFCLLLPPSYWSKALDEQALLQFYRDVADASPIPLVCYNFPQVTPGQDLTSDDLLALAEHPNIVAAKLTCANVGKGIRVTSKLAPNQFSIFGGSSDFLVPTLEAGGSGCVAALGNVFPRATSRLYDLWASGQRDEAKRLQDIISNAEWACKKGVVLTKYGASYFVGPKIGVSKEAFYPRRPYRPATQKMQSWTIDIMGVLMDEEKSEK